jgi:hypothetical protein
MKIVEIELPGPQLRKLLDFMYETTTWSPPIYPGKWREFSENSPGETNNKKEKTMNDKTHELIQGHLAEVKTLYDLLAQVIMKSFNLRYELREYMKGLKELTKGESDND